MGGYALIGRCQVTVRPIALLLLSLIALGGCTTWERSQPSSSEEISVPAPERPSARPQTKAVTVQIEGMAETLTVSLLEPPDPFPLDFSTYVPEDFQVETVSSGEGDALRITAAFGGQPNEQALFTIFAFPERVDVEAAQQVAEQTAQTMGGTPVEDRRYAWTLAEYQLQGERSGFLALGEHGGSPFYLLATYPPEFGDGMAPRIKLILREWRWADGQFLASYSFRNPSELSADGARSVCELT